MLDAERLLRTRPEKADCTEAKSTDLLPSVSVGMPMSGLQGSEVWDQGLGQSWASQKVCRRLGRRYLTHRSTMTTRSNATSSPDAVLFSQSLSSSIGTPGRATEISHSSADVPRRKTISKGAGSRDLSSGLVRSGSKAAVRMRLTLPGGIFPALAALGSARPREEDPSGEGRVWVESPSVERERGRPDGRVGDKRDGLERGQERLRGKVPEASKQRSAMISGRLALHRALLKERDEEERGRTHTWADNRSALPHRGTSAGGTQKQTT